MSFVSNSTNTTAAIGPSASLTTTQTIFQYSTYFVCAPVAIFGNLAMALGILRSKKEKTRFNIIIVFLLISRVLMALMLINYGTYRMLKYYDLISNPSRLGCAVLMIALFPTTLELFFMLFLALDRVAALFTPIRYHFANWRAAVRDCTAILVVVMVAKIGMLYGDPPLTTIVLCVPAYQAAPANLQSFFAQFDFALLVFLLVIYVFMFIGLKVRLRRLRSRDDQPALVSFNRQAAVMPTVRNIILVHGAFTLSSKGATLSSIVPILVPISNELLFISGMTVSLELVVNVVVLLGTNQDIKKATRALFTGNNVGPAGGSNTRSQQ